MICEKKSYAKINLSLRVVKRKKNGFHGLQSIMSLIDFYDDIEFYESDTIEVITTPYICEEKDNLCYKVAIYLKKYAKVNKGIKISINKKIPSGGGLGGGSSNAAVVLLFLNEYWEINFSKRKLMKIAFLFGADIPYFISGRQSFVSGSGEKIRNIKKPIVNDVILIVPSFSLETKKVFQSLDIGKIKKRENKKIRIFSNMFNDLEDSANMLSKNSIINIKNQVALCGKGVTLMSGSGSTIVYYVKKDEDPIVIYNKIKEQLTDCKIILTKMKTN
ncbi:MAG: 4-(cytidine 5'-diphospho)-2-C-methyl-D-erythritol kinase [Methanobrevibacter sp.]|nr:4-(cytidine 5'-diphospho)-2-C-methyl-D-erythritol kinase [Methanobrevibacter sp.]